MHILPSSLVEMMIPALLSICACTLLSAPAQAQVSRPSNDMADLFLPAPDMNYQLHTRQFSLPPTNLAPLTTDLKRMFRDGFESDFNITGILVIIGANNASTTSGDDIVLISCDESAYSGESKVDDTLRLAITAPSSPSAIILYTTEFAHCNYTPEVLSWPQYRNIFTVTNPLAAREILAGIHSDEKSLGNTNIVPDMSIAPFRAGEEGGQRNNAMIILYSITGIITALFLTVIVTGAIRAHLNPERYGPRNAVGRPRQSRAKGIARAMLETLPIIKFGDPENGKPPTAKPDVELASTYGDTEHDRSRSDPRVAGVITPETRQLEQHQQQQPQPEEQQQQQQVAQTVAAPSASHIDANKEQQQDEGVIGPASPEPQTVSPDQTTDASALGCPICTDDFIKGQDVRLLPCQHKFHPECVDPWLINVSGTCPLCRVNLNPPEPDPDPEDPTTNTGPPTTTTTHPQSRLSSSRRYHGLSTYFVPASSRGLVFDTGADDDNDNENLQSRLNTLRRMRNDHQATNSNNMTAAGAIESSSSRPVSGSLAVAGRAGVAPGQGQGQADEASRRNRLSTRLRERFRVRTRRHGGDGDVDVDGGRGSAGASAGASPSPTANAGGDAETPTEYEPSP